ncbi:MAG: 2-C-methyl-D-erythritol 4-phosphate cytidylyltransferase, partial [Roseburia sp.]|nr:2-C-methyl-D-erythritol 4-phosphate cytidylyltransferase [Roseburia sp.]
MKKYTAVVLAAGAGKRMNTKVHKQYLEVAGKPLLYYTLKAFEESGVDDIVLVTGAGEETYCRREIVEKYGFHKIKAVVPGGKERYHSVYQGLLAAEGADYVLIHDGARPLVEQEVIERCMESVEKYQACVVGMPVKDTIKIVDREQFAKETPDRSTLWQVQTPQT